MSKSQVILTDRDLAQLCVVNEPVNVKGGAWDECGVFVYTTLNHIKYLLPSGDGGIIRTIDDVVYVIAIKNGVLHCLDRQMMPRRIKIETSEYRFKIALEKKQFKDVLSIIKHSSLCGSAIIAYLQQKGFPEVALHFVKGQQREVRSGTRMWKHRDRTSKPHRLWTMRHVGNVSVKLH